MLAYIRLSRSGCISVQNFGHTVSANASTRLLHTLPSRFKTIAYNGTNSAVILTFPKLYVTGVPILSRARTVSSTATRLATSGPKTNEVKGRSKDTLGSSSTETKSKSVRRSKAATPKTKQTKKIVPKKPKMKISEVRPPKKPASPYLRFHMQRWREIESSSKDKEVAGQTFFTISAESGKIWKTMSDQEKKPYIDEYERLIDAYRVALADYWEKTDRTTLLAMNKVRRARGQRLFHPKRDVKEPIRPFPQFMREYRQSNSVGHLNGREMVSNAAAEWRKLSDEQRSVYSETYKRALADFKASQSTSTS